MTRIQAVSTHLSQLKSLFRPGFIDYLKRCGMPPSPAIIAMQKLKGARARKPIFVPLGDDRFDALLKLLRVAVSEGHNEWAWVLVVVFFALIEVRHCHLVGCAWLRRPGHLTLPGAQGTRYIEVPDEVYDWLSRQTVFQPGADLSGTTVQLHLHAAMRHLRRIESDKWQVHPLAELYNHGVALQIQKVGYDKAFLLTGRKSITNFRRFFKREDAMGAPSLARCRSLIAAMKRT